MSGEVRAGTMSITAKEWFCCAGCCLLILKVGSHPHWGQKVPRFVTASSNAFHYFLSL